MHPSKSLPIALVAALPALLVACGGTSGPPPTPTATTSPDASPPASPTGQRPSTPLPGVKEIDLATHSATMTIWGVGAGDFRSDVPALTVGDFNDDGLQDILVGARFADGEGPSRQDSGTAYAVFGSQRTPATVDLTEGEQGLTILGAAGGDNLGFALASSDVNADGVEDILVGAPFAKPAEGRWKTGATYVIFGKRGLGGTIDVAAGEQDLTLVGPNPSSFFGDSLASGDINGDGMADIIVGATFARDQTGASQPGAVFAVFGSLSLGGTLDMASDQYDVAVYGAEDLDEVGDTVASGDVNGDGIDDIIIAAEAADGPDNTRLTAAEVYVVYGSRQLGGVLEIDRGAPDVTVFAADDNDTLGLSLASGDVDGDGIDDIVMGARSGDGPDNRIQGAGEIIIVLGRKDLPSVIDLAQGEEDANLYGSDAADLMAFGGLGDVDGDGDQEILAGTGYGDGSGNERADAGELYVVDGNELAGAMPVGISPRLLTVYGAQPEDHLGTSAASGDINGDGKADIIVIAEDADGPGGSRPDAGQIYMLSVP